MKFTISNPEMIPPNLPPGKYTTRVISATFEEIVVEFLGKYYDPNDPCLLPLTKEEVKEDPINWVVTHHGYVPRDSVLQPLGCQKPGCGKDEFAEIHNCMVHHFRSGHTQPDEKEIPMPEPHGEGYGVDDSMENPDKY